MIPQLKMSIPRIRSKIDLNIHPWKNVYSSNCYAFALGLDVSEDAIVNKSFLSPYYPGTIASAKLRIPFNELNNLSIEERLLLDLKILKIDVQEASVKDDDYTEKTRNYERLSWIISRYGNREDFHFARKTINQEWWHKRGFVYSPEKLKSGIDPIPMDSHMDYEHIKTYRLTMTRQKRRF